MFARMSRSRRDARVSAAVMVASVAAMLAVSGEALADRGGRGRGCGGGGGYGYGYKGSYCGSKGSGSSFSISIGSGWGSCGSGWAVNYGYSSGWGYSGCRPYRSYSCAPRYSYCPPAVVVAPPPVVYAEPVVVQRPVYVDRVVERRIVVERPVEVAPAAAPAPAEPPPTPIGYRDRELGDAYMKLADWNNAVRVYRRYLSAWDKDGTALRNLGLAQIAAGNAREGFANVVRGHQLEPGLTERLSHFEAVVGREAVEQLADAAVLAADGVNSAEAWFTVALVQCMAGQAGSAEAALKRARDAGLSPQLLDSLALKVASLKA